MSDIYKYQAHNHAYWSEEFKFKWPAGDKKLQGDMHTLTDLDEHVFPRIQSKRVAVQAGGAVGVWPKRMAQVFEAVYTFEPNPESFHCLVCNCPETNIVKIQAALGSESGMVTMKHHEMPDNYGAFRCHKGGIVPTLRLDDLGLEQCDLIMLDIEGYELFALKGAKEVIDKYHPVIVLEDKGCSRNFGYPKKAVEKHLMTHGYSKFIRFHNGRDVLCR